MQVVIATKAGITSSFRGYDFSAPALRASLEGSLRRLRTDYVDLFQLHNAGPDVILRQPHIVELLQRFVAEGKVRAFGFSTPTPDDALALLDVSGCRVLPGELQSVGLAGDRGGFVRPRQVARTSASSRALRWPLAFSPDGSTGTRSSPATITAASGRESGLPRGSRPRIASSRNSISRTARQAVWPWRLRFCLSFEAVATVIPGMLSPAEVLANVVACDEGPLNSSEIRCVENVYRRYEARLKA